MANLLFDTDVIIDFLRGYEKSREFLTNNSKSHFFLSSISIAELYSGVRNIKEEREVSTFIMSFSIVEITKAIAIDAGSIRKKYGKSHGTGLADALIASCAQETSSTLATLNKKHYPMIKDIIIPYKK